MGITKTADGRYQVGKGIADANNYTGALGKRDMVIQYTEDGVTAQSMEYLNFLKDYAEHHADIGELIKPSDVSIWIAKDDKLTAVEADDISYDDGTFTLSSITYDGTDWTFGEPTPGGGGGVAPVIVTNESFLSDITTFLTALITASTDTAIRVKRGVEKYGDEELFEAFKSIHENGSPLEATLLGVTFRMRPVFSRTFMVEDDVFYYVQFANEFFQYTNNYKLAYEITAGKSAEGRYFYQIGMSCVKMALVS